MTNNDFKGEFTTLRRLPEWALFAMCIQHIKYTAAEQCNGGEACDLAIEAAHEVFFHLQADMRACLVEVCYALKLEPVKVFGWSPEDFLRPVQ